MTPPTEYPGNAAVDERNRRMRQEEADRATREGDAEGAARWQEQADEWTARRDAEVRREEMRVLNRRAHRRGYGGIR